MKTMNDYTCHCTEEQTRRAYELGAPIEKNYCETLNQTTSFSVDDMYLVIPTTQQMVNWLRDKFGVLVVTKYNSEKKVYFGCIKKFGDFAYIGVTDGYFSYDRAELAAIDAALDYLEKGGMI